MKKWIKALIISCLAVPTMQLFILNPFEQAADFSMSDFYIRTANKMRLSTISNQVVIIPVDNLSRLEIAQIAEKADYFGAKTIALDVFMNWHTDVDKETVDALSACDNLILPSSLTENFISPVFNEIKNAQYGYTNLECNWDGAKIRSFSSKKEESISFAAAACGIYDSKQGIIRYDCKEFEIIYPEELSNTNVQGKILFIGNLNDFSDCHPTPVGVLPGVMIHAYIARTIIENCAPKTMSKVLGYILTFMIVVLLFMMHAHNNTINGDFANFIMRIVQFVTTIFLYLVGAILFVKFNIYADVSLVILLISAMLLVFDIFYGCFSIANILRNRFEKRKRIK